MSIISGKPVGATQLLPDAVALFSSCLSGPVDIDKLDYLVRDSLHAGVPYGRNFDESRLLASLTVHPDQPKLAIGEKGRTAAEMMVFSRYVMFSEVYWHHAVRSATAMLQRLVFGLKPAMDLVSTFDLSEANWIGEIQKASVGTEFQSLAEGLFGSTRKLYKRVAEFNVLDGGDLHRELAHRPYWWLVACGDELADRCSLMLGRKIAGSEILIDAPPVKLEVDINMDVVMRSGIIRRLGDVSPVADSLAHQQFDGHVKRVRVFVRPEIQESVAEILQDDRLIRDAIGTTNQRVV
jgi:HD superfamily phosphohydrolase